MSTKINLDKIFAAKVPKERFRVLPGMVLISIYPLQEVADVHVIIPDNTKNDGNWVTMVGVVVSAEDTYVVKRGDRVLLTRGVEAQCIRFQGDELLLIEEKMISGIIPRPSDSTE